MAERFGDEMTGETLSSADVARLSEQLGGLARAGLPLASGLRALAEEVSSRRLRRVLIPLAAALEAGNSLEAALGMQKRAVPPQLRSLVLAGSRTGRIGDVLGRFAGFANVGADLRRSTVLRLVYPAFSFVFAMLVFVFACTVLMAGFEKIFADFGMRIPLVTRAVFSLARGVTRAWWPVCQGLFLLGALWLALCFVGGSRFRWILMAEVPLIGPVWRMTGQAEFCHLLALLIESDVPLVEAVTMAGEGAGDGGMSSAASLAADEIAAGNSFGSALVTRRLFPPGFARILGWAEGHRGLPEALHMAGEMFEARARTQAEFVGAACSVLVILSILGGVALAVMAIMIPMISLISRLSG